MLNEQIDVTVNIIPSTTNVMTNCWHSCLNPMALAKISLSISSRGRKPAKCKVIQPSSHRLLWGTLMGLFNQTFYYGVCLFTTL